MKVLFEIGDTVTVKEWDVMIQEYGMVGDCPNISLGFNHHMECYCGKTAIIIKSNLVSIHRDIKLFEFILQFEEDTNISFWSFSEEMLILKEDDLTKMFDQLRKKQERRFDAELI